MTLPQEISKYFVSHRELSRLMKLSVILMNLLLIHAVAFIESSMMTAAAAAILVSIRPSQVMLLFTSHHIIFQKTVDETSQPRPFFSIIILMLSKAEEEP